MDSEKTGAALLRILSSAVFKRAPQAAKFLNFIVSKSLSGDAAAVKGSVIAIEVFGKAADVADSIVRTGANRLRQKLREYYESEGRLDPIEICLPESGYVPVFRTRTWADASLEKYVLVGRDSELAMVEDEVRLALNSHGRLTCIVAEPGVGKTALVEACLWRVGQHLRLLIGTAKCHSLLQAAEPYHVWLDLLANLAPALTGMIQETAPHWQQMLLGPVPETATPTVLFRELERLLELLRSRQKIVLFIDDLHWADPLSIDLLSQLLPQLRRLNVPILTTYRASDMKLRQSPFLAIEPELKMKGLCRDLELRTLPVSAVQHFLDERMPGHNFVQEVAAELHVASGGNALCVRDMVQLALEKQWIVASATGQWTFTAPAHIWRTELPQSVAAMAAKKLGELNEEDRDLLFTASLGGVEFDTRVVAIALDQDLAAIEERLQRLHIDNQLVRPLSSTRYEFAHVLYFDALQASSGGSSASASRKTARALVEVFGAENETVASMTARLFEAGGEIGRAVPFYAIAIRRAIALSAFRQANDLCEHVLALLRTSAFSSENARLEIQLLNAQNLAIGALFGFQHEKLQSMFERSRLLAGKLGDPAASMFSDMAYWSFTATQDYERGLEIATDLLQRSRKTRNAEYIVNSGLALGVSLLHSGDLRRAVATFQRVHLSAKRRGTGVLLAGAAVDPQVVILANWARALWYSGRVDTALATVTQAKRTAEALGHRKTIAYALTLMADVLHLRRDVLAAIDIGRQAMEMSREYGFAYEMTWAAGFAASAETENDNPEVACRLWDSMQSFDGPCSPKLWSHCAWGFAAVGKIEKAHLILDQALATVDRRREFYYKPELLRRRAELYMFKPNGRSSLSMAIKDLRQAARIADRQGNRILLLRTRTSLLKFAHQCERRLVRTAASELASTIARFREGLQTSDLIEAKELLR